VGPRIYKLPLDTTTPEGFEKISLQTNNRLTIDGWYAAKDSAKSCIIFFHGITNNKAVLLKEANEFRKLNYNVLLIDFRAHGNSAGNKSSFGFEETDEAAQAFLFAQKKGNKNIIVYGSSMGSVVVLKAAAENKIAPSAIIADMPFGTLQDHLKARARVLGFPSQPFAFLVTLWIGIENGYNAFRLQTDEYAKEIQCPVLIQWGDKDIYVTREEINSIYNNLATAQKKLVVYPNANHESFLNYDPINWQEEMSSFLGVIKK
jgi:alpha-beta hydrolase superfamily lysophospholipase